MKRSHLTLFILCLTSPLAAWAGENSCEATEEVEVESLSESLQQSIPVAVGAQSSTAAIAFCLECDKDTDKMICVGTMREIEKKYFPHQCQPCQSLAGLPNVYVCPCPH